ncbi:MAG: thiolase family protein, partial [Actinomycetota bacterium]|nr:thiolase family protein [Actinomycetota bacterium]
ADNLGLSLEWMGPGGAGAQLGVMITAAMAVASGLCRHVLIFRSVHGLGGLLNTPSHSAGLPGPEGALEYQVPFHEYSAAHLVAMQARRHMHQYGTTKEQLGWVAVTSRYHAGFNEQAVYRTPMTIDDYLAAPLISDPLGRLDCDFPIDGACAMVISRYDVAKDTRHRPICFEAVGCANRTGPFTWNARLDGSATAATDAAAQLWRRTGLTPGDVDAAMLYDGFSYLTLTWLEALGFCGEGEAGSYVEGGARIQLGGDLPLNTYGGQLSAGRLHGFWLFHEAVLQLRGDAGLRQVVDAEVIVASAGGAHNCGVVLLTR